MRQITYGEAIRESMSQEFRVNDDVYILGEDIGVFGGAFGVTNGMVAEFGKERVRDTPISEMAIGGCAVGSAMTGMRPILELQFSDFITYALDSIVNQAAKMSYMYQGKVKVPMVVRLPSGSGLGFAFQHSQSLEALTTHFPGLKVVQPSSPYDAKGLLKAAMDDNNPVLFFEHKALYGMKGDVPEEQYSVELGKGDIKRIGEDVTIVATGIMVNRSLEAAEQLEKEGISIEIIDPRTLVPLDVELIVNSVKKTGRVIVVHEAVKRGGYGSEIASMIAESEAFDYLDAPIMRVGGLPVPIPFSPNLEKKVVPQVEEITQAVKTILNKG
jgi:acetoin:2,6-dichlorophenolindophenol oxidoreductase subunit beta